MNADKDKRKRKPYADDYNKDRVLGCLGAGYPNGKSTAEMEESIEIHHDTVLRKCNELREDGLVLKKGGKRGKYYLTEHALGEPNLIAGRFGHRAIIEVMDQEVPLCLDNVFCNKQIIRTILDSVKISRSTTEKDGILNIYKRLQLKNHSRILEPEATQAEDLRKLQMFETVNRIGALVTYFLIDALNPNKIPIVTGKKSKIKYIQKEGAMQTDLIDRRLRNELQPLLLLWEFKNLLTKERVSLNTKDKIRSPYHIFERDFKLLLNTFSDIYPNISKKLESVKKEIEGEIKCMYTERNIEAQKS